MGEDVELAPDQVLGTELRRRLPDRADLGVGGGVVRLSDEVDRLGDDLAPLGDDASEGAASSLDVGVGQVDGSLDQIHEDTPCARRSMGSATDRRSWCNAQPTERILHPTNP